MKTVPKLSRNWKHQSSGKPEESPENRSETWLTTSSDASKSASRGEGLIWSMFFKLLKKQWKNLHNDLKFCANIMQSLNLMLKKTAIVYVVFSPFYYCLNGSKTFLTTRYFWCWHCQKLKQKIGWDWVNIWGELLPKEQLCLLFGGATKSYQKMMIQIYKGSK